MNKIFKKLPYITFTVMVAFLASCEDDDKDPLVIEENQENFAPYVRIVVDASTPVIDATQLSSDVFISVVDDPNDNVASWQIGVRQITSSNDTVPAPVDGEDVYATIGTITSFPSEFNLTGDEIAATLGIPASNIQPGDQIQFDAVSTGTDGSTLTFADLGGDLAGQFEQFQAYNFTQFVGCPFVQADAVGTYDVVAHRFDGFFGPQGATREVIAGGADNEYTIVGGALPLDGADDLTVSVDAGSGVVLGAANADDVHFNTFGPASYGTVAGFTFSCVGFIDLDITSPGFIRNDLTMQKQ